MKMFEKIMSSFIRRTTLGFSLIVLAVIIISSYLEVLDWELSPGSLLTYYLFSALLAVSFGIADFIQNNVILRRTVQFILSYLSLVIVIFPSEAVKNYLGQMQNPSFSILMITFVFVITYTIIALGVLVVAFIKKCVENSTKEYERKFDKKSN